MFLLDAPYVSDILKQTIVDLKQPVLDTLGARRMTEGYDIEFIDEIEFSARLAMGQRVLANSENALGHIFACGCNEDLGRQIDVCKDKAVFRETIRDLHPEYAFMTATPEEMGDLDISDMPVPFVVKPARGFFSLGVHVVNDPAEWPAVVETIRGEREAMNREYPEEVVNSTKFIIEQGIEGDEYAIDVYFDEDGEPVITNILYHHFLTADDISDRLYYTSGPIIRKWLEPFTDYISKVGKECKFRNFPMHIEVRVDDSGNIVPIEANPMRFAGWCVADITQHAWGINPYECYFKGLRPDWPELITQRQDNACVMVIGDVPPIVERETIESVDYDAFCERFDNVIELRKIDYTAYPVFAFVFADMKLENMGALKEGLIGDFGGLFKVKA